MRQEFRQIHHIKTEQGFKAIPYPGKYVRIHPEDAAVRNNHFPETGVLLVPKNAYEKYLQNQRLLN
jgi:hypothetical protein